MKPTDVDSSSDPLCPEPDVRPRHNFHVNITLTSFPSLKTHILLSSLKTADRRRLNATHVSYPCRTYYAHLTTDARSHQFESVTVDTRWTHCTYLKTCGLVDFGMCFYSLQCEMHVHKLGTATRSKPIVHCFHLHSYLPRTPEYR